MNGCVLVEFYLHIPIFEFRVIFNYHEILFLSLFFQAFKNVKTILSFCTRWYKNRQEAGSVFTRERESFFLKDLNYLSSKCFHWVKFLHHDLMFYKIFILIMFVIGKTKTENGSITGSSNYFIKILLTLNLITLHDPCPSKQNTHTNQTKQKPLHGTYAKRNWRKLKLE